MRIAPLPSRDLFSDEAITQIRVAGHTEAGMFPLLYDGRPRSIPAVRAAVRVDERSTYGALIHSLQLEDAQHPPLFYVAELSFVRMLGDSLLAWRLLAAICGVLGIIAAYALARAIFTSADAALLAGALFAVSPVQRLYSEQCREYSLFMLFELLATLALVAALRVSSPGRWAVYSGATLAGLYTSPFMLSIVVAHAVYVAVVVRERPARALGFVAAAGLALVAFVPWVHEIVVHRDMIAKTNAWSAERWSSLRLVTKWAFNAGTTFFDLEYLDVRWSIVLFGVVAAAAAGIVIMFRRAEPHARWLLGTLIVVPALLLIIPDLAFGQHRSGVTRYELPTFAALSIATAFGLARRPALAIFVLTAAAAACIVSSLHPSWWDNDANADDRNIAAAINTVARPYVVTSIAPEDAIAASRLLRDDARLVLFDNHITEQRTSTHDPIFVLRPSADDRAEARAKIGWMLEPVMYRHALSAHDIGSRLAPAAAGERASRSELFRVVFPGAKRVLGTSRLIRVPGGLHDGGIHAFDHG